MRYAAAALAVMVSTAAFAAEPPSQPGPFGFKRGMTMEELRKLGLSEAGRTPGRFYAKTAPKPHPDFEKYLVVVSPTSGLCKVVGFGRDIPTNAYGDRLKTVFDSLEKVLITKYGEGDKSDFLFAGSIWRDPNDWTTALAKEERILSRIWTDVQPNSKVPAGTDSIMLKAKATNQSTGYVVLSIDFTNIDSCFEELEKSQNDAL